MNKFKYLIEFEKIGTSIKIEIIVKGKKELEKIKKETVNIVKIYERMEAIFSRFKENSELMRVNNNLKKFNKTSGELRRMAKHYISYYKESNKIFDPRVIYVLEQIGYNKDISKIRGIKLKKLKLSNFEDSIFKNSLEQEILFKEKSIQFLHKMDFSGATKGRVNDLVSQYLKQKGFNNFKINSGGDLYLSGKNSNNFNWRINVEGVSEDKLIFNLSNLAISTSADDRRSWFLNNKKVSHLIRKNKVNKENDLKKVSVIAKTSQEADFLSTYLFLMGYMGYNIAKDKKIAAMFITSKEAIKITPQMKNYLN